MSALNKSGEETGIMALHDLALKLSGRAQTEDKYNSTR